MTSIPGLIGLGLAAGIFYAAYGFADDIGGLLMQWYPWELGSGIVEGIADVFGGLLILVLGLAVFKQLVMVVTGPFMSPLSEKVEEYVTR